MQVPTVRLGPLDVSRFIIGGNPFSGFSHQSRERSAEMLAWYADDRIVETLFQAEGLGLNAFLCRGDDHMAGVAKAYWSRGGTMRWLAQTNSRAPTAVEGAKFCLGNGACAVYLHGGVVDHLIAQGRYDELYAFAYAAHAMRPMDMVCAGVYTKDNPNMLAEDVNLILDALCAAGR